MKIPHLNDVQKLLFILSVITFTASCKHEDCSKIDCVNGSCVHGICYCPDGYYGDYCQFYDSCWNVTCLNGGICVNGKCDCPDGYSGTACEITPPPLAFRITQVDLLAFPQTNLGTEWDDVNDPPDVYVTICTGGNAHHDEFVSGSFNNSFGPLIYTSQHGLPTDPADPGVTYTIGAWDIDDSGDILMDQKHFTPLQSASGFPETIHLTWTGWDCYLHVEWIF